MNKKVTKVAALKKKLKEIDEKFFKDQKENPALA
jgi:hypothetical protein